MNNIKNGNIKPIFEAEQAIQEGLFLKAEKIISKIPKNDDSYEYGQLLLANIAFQNGRPEKSIEILEPLQKTEEVIFALAASLRAVGKEDEAINCYLSMGTPHCQYAAAQALMQQERFEEAYNILKLLNNQYPNDVAILFALANSERNIGLIDEAINHFKQIIKIDNGYVLAYINLIGLTSYSKDLFDIKILEEISNSVAIDKMTEALVRNALGKCYEKLGDYKKSFEEYSKANQYIRSTFPDDVLSQHRELAERIEKNFTKEMVDAFWSSQPNKSDNKCNLIFIFGMPRSGSTLIEQILINHPDIETAGETPNVQLEIIKWLKEIENGTASKKFPKTKEDLSALSKEYLEKRLQINEKYKNAKYIIDKMPANYNYIGLMAMLFPNAKFIFTKRNKADVCLSGWATIYSNGHGYSYTLEEISEEYDIHERIVNHWFKIMPKDSIHTVEYEKMIFNFDEELNKLCKYLGIECTPEMKTFYKLKRRVNTASVGQVNRPLYKDSVGRASKFGDLLKVLQNNDNASTTSTTNTGGGK